MMTGLRLVKYMPTAIPQQRRDPPITIAPVFAGQLHDLPRQRVVICSAKQIVVLCPSPLPQQPVGSLDCPRSISMAKIVKAEWRLDSAFPLRHLMCRLEFGHWPRPVVPVANPSWKEILTFCRRNSPIKNWK